MVAVVVLVVSVLAALLVARYSHSGLAGTGIAVLIGGGTLPALYLAWATYRDGQALGGDLSLEAVADQLAVAVGAQWETEATLRRLNDPYPLPVSWVAADASLAEDWNVLVTLAVTGAGWGRSPVGTWAAGPEKLAGTGTEMADVLARVPTGRLVVLGEPGAGKTILMVRLVLDMLARRESGGVVPALVSVASWNPTQQDLREWLAGQMAVDHPALASPAPTGAGEGTRIAALWNAGLIMPILDGLDEIPDAMRRRAIMRINEAMRPGAGLMLTCRTQAYRDAIEPESVPPLRAAAAIQLCPLDAGTVAGYLRDGAGPAAVERWEPVIDRLGTSAPLGQVLVTPLMVGLARAVYGPDHDGHAGLLRDPAELCDPSLAHRASIERHLFDAFVPAAYRAQNRDSRWSPKKAESWLVFLARHLETTISGTDLAWWQLQQAVSPAVTGLVTGSAAGSVLGVASGLKDGPIVGLVTALASALATGLGAAKWRMLERAQGAGRRFTLRRLALVLAVGFATGLAVGVAFGLSTGLSKGPLRGLEAGSGPALAGLAGGLAVGFAAVRWELPQPSRGLRWRLSVSGMTAGISVGLVAGLATGIPYGLFDGLTSGIPIGLAVGLTVGLKVVPPDLTATASPGAVLDRDRRSALIAFFSVGLGLGFGVGFGFPLPYGILVGFAYGFAFALVVTVRRTAWPSYQLTRGWLAVTRRLPWSVMAFLADAHQRGILRQAGIVYQFRHIELQRRLADRASNLGVER